jgi:transposase
MGEYTIEQTVFVGLDYHQAAVQVCVLDRSGRILWNGSVPNDAEKIVGCVKRFAGRVEAAIESCTGAACLADELTAAGWSVALAHTGYVARIKQSPDKTDWQDARLLADLIRVGYLPRVWLPPEWIRDLRRLVHYRQGLTRERRSIKLRIRSVLRELRLYVNCRAWTAAWLGWLEHTAPLPEQARWIVTRHLQRLRRLVDDIREVEHRLEQAVAKDAFVERLRQQKGVGLVTAVTLRAEFGRVTRFRSGKQMSRFCGLSPCNASSGTRQADAGLVKAGNAALRVVLIEAAHRLWRFDPRWSDFGNRLLLAGKAYNVIVAAIANRWVRSLYHQLKTVAA